MNIFSELKFAVYILYFMTLFSGMFSVEAVKIECIKSDECSCKTKTNPQQEIYLWTIQNPGLEIYSAGTTSWRYDINLCHEMNKNINAPDRGCRNSTVCQYKDDNKNQTFELGHFGSAKFGQYDNETKSIILTYSGIHQEKIARSIQINLICFEDGNVTRAEYFDVATPVPPDPSFQTRIKTKAACLRSAIVPTSYIPSSHGGISSNGGRLKTVYIVLIVVAGLLLILAVGAYAASKMVARRRRGLLVQEEENQDYGTVQRLHVQNALSTSASGPV